MIPTTKKLALLVFCLFITTSSLCAQQEKGIVGYNNWLNPWTEFKPNHIDYGEPTQILSGNITEDTKLFKKDVYLLLGEVFVSEGATLTIEPGTVIIGDYSSKGSLIISKGSKIIAIGEETDPIIFTSGRSAKKPGDWGGLFLLGDAPLNTFAKEASLNYGLRPSSFQYISYGGDNPESNTGILKYVRIEFAGKRTKDYGYFNGLTLAGVGTATVIENVMVSYCEGNAYNVLGGAVILNQTVSYKANRNDFEFNYGTQSTITNSLAIRSPYVSSAEGSLFF